MFDLIFIFFEKFKLLERSLKMFIKTACCFPEKITKQEYDSILNQLQHSEKVNYFSYFRKEAPFYNKILGLLKKKCSCLVP